MTIDDLLNIPHRMEPIGGQTHAYIRREEAIYMFEQLIAERDQLSARIERLTLQKDGAHPAPCAGHCEAQAFKIRIRELEAERDALKARLDGGVRVYAYKDPECNDVHSDCCHQWDNATLIPDKGVEL